MKLSDRERKLLLLAFDPGAAMGEAAAAIRALAREWITRYPDGHALVKDLESPEKIVIREKIVYRNANPYGSVVLGFGKYRGEALQDIPTSYLLWVLENFEDLWPDTRKAIERYLAG